MRKNHTSISSTWNRIPFFRLYRFSVIRRDLHIKSAFVARGSDNKIGSIIIRTDNDQASDEDDVQYVKRSFFDLEKAVTKDFNGKDLLILKINQCVIDPDKWVNENIVEAYYHGHVLSGLFEIHSLKPTLVPIKDSIISKSRKGIEAEDVVLQQRFFYNKIHADEARNKGSQEYFWIISLDKLHLTRQTYLNRCKMIRDNPGRFDLLISACGQKVFNLLTDKAAPEYKSPQSASKEGVIEILRDNDKVFTTELRNALIKSGLSTTAYEMGKTYLENLNYDKNSLKDSGSSNQHGRS